MFAVITNVETEVNITLNVSPQGFAIVFNNSNYLSGNTLQYKTKGIHSLLVQMCKHEQKVSLTNTKVTGDKPVGVIVGNCPKKSGKTCSENVADQAKMTYEGTIDMMPPEVFYGVEFIAPGIIYKSIHSYLIIIATVGNTLITYAGTPSANSQKVIDQPGVFLGYIKDVYQPFSISSSSSVGLVLIHDLPCTKENRPGGSAFLQPMSLFSNNYLIVYLIKEIGPKLKHYLVLTFATDDMDSIIIQTARLATLSPKLQTVSGKEKMSVAVINVERGSLQVLGDVSFGCLMYSVNNESLAMHSTLPKRVPKTAPNFPEDDCRGQPCPPSHVGEDCDTICHCNDNKCDSNGSCTNGSHCSAGWFGPACQYWDAASTSTTLNSTLRDGNDRTCLNSDNKTEEITLSQPVLFSWVRVVFHRAALVTITNMKLTTVENGDSDENECAAMRITEPAYNTYDVFCSVITIVSAITIKWTGPGQICSINMNGGQIVKLNKTVISCSSIGPFDVNHLFDDDISINSCFILKNSLTITKDSNEDISGIRIYYASSDQPFAINVVLLTSDKLVITNINLNDRRPSPIFIPFDMLKFSRMHIDLISGALTICGIEMLGECSTCKHGLNCEESCRETCLQERCNRDGTCYQCSKQSTQKFCEMESPQFNTKKPLEVNTEKPLEDDESCPKDSQCHCDQNLCDENLKCLQGSRCIKPWFTESCQYYDLAALSTTDSHILTDHNDSTCYHSNNLTVKLSVLLAFTWARIRLDKRVDPSALTLSLLTNKDKRTTCSNQRTVEIADNTWDIFCSNLVYVNEIYVSINLDVSVCSIYINAGREFAQKSSIQVPDLPVNRVTLMNLVKLLNDGVSNHDMCLILSQESLKTILITLRLERPITLLKIQSHKDQTENFTLRMKGFDSRDSLMFNVSTANRETIHIAFASKPFTARVQLDILEGQLELCEIQIFGDCPSPSYGSDCGATCPMSCLGQTCTQDRTCHRCYEGRVGKTCSEGLRCPTGYTGKECEILCHCKNQSCDVNGYCTKGSHCDIGWFGPACQYRNIASTAMGLNELLKDNNDTTCYKNEKKNIEVKFHWPVVFTWARVVFHKSALVAITALKFMALDDGNMFTATCQSLRTVEKPDNSFDVFCTEDTVVESVKLQWKGTGQICSLYVNGGRNVGLGAAVERCNYNTPKNFRAIFDGNSGIDSCFTFNSNYKPLELITNSNLIVTGISVHTKTTAETYTLHLMCLDAANKAVCDHTSGRTDEKSFHIPVMKAAVSKLSFLLKSGSLTICELEMYGECPPLYYGLYCNETCSERCFDGRCNFDGHCRQSKEKNDTVLCEPDEPTTSTIPEKDSCPNDTICHCTDNACNDSLSCKDGRTCEKPWFSLGCEYYDAAYTAIVDSPLLTDHNDSTCHTSQNLIFQLNGSIVFTWAKIVFEKKETSLFTLKFRVVDEKNDKIQDCLQQRTVETNKNMYDVFCANSLTVDRVIVAWNASVRVCSVYINTGRNFALKASASFIDEPATTKRIRKLLASIHDGISTQNECITLSDDYMNTLKMTLRVNRPVSLVHMHIHLDQSEDYNVKVRLFEAHNPNNSLFESSIQNKQKIVYLAFPSRLVISALELNMVKGSLAICDLRIFGDCPAQTYGVNCEKVCPISCLNRSCSQDGTCLQCHKEGQGQFCTDGIRCPKGYTGKQCEILCHCKNDSCDVNGHCINESHCDIGWFGPACQYPVVVITALEFTTLVNSEKVNKTCRSLRTPDVIDNSFDVFCNEVNIVESVTLVWRGTKQICSLYINAGRNVGLGEAAAEGCNYSSHNNFKVIFAGNSGTHSCFTFRSNYDALQLITNNNQIVTGINILKKTTAETYSFNVKCMNATNNAVCDHTSSQSADKSLNIPVMKATVSKLIINVTTGSLTICEFQMYGECPPPYYGLYCNQTCSDQCVGRQCNFDGACHQCAEKNNNVLCESDAPTTSTKPKEVSSCQSDTKCHCTNHSCKDNLSCQDGATCEKPWFSLACQYYDAAHSAVVDSPLLTDHDDATCYSSQNLIFQLKGSVVFTWVRIVFEEKETALVTLKFHVVDEGVDDIKDCLEQRTVETNKNTIDVFCANTLTVDQVMVSWNASVQVCSVYINTGRNYALKASASFTDEQASTTRIKKLMASVHDGISPQNDCIILSDDYMNTLKMTLQINRPVALVHIHIHPDQSEDYNVKVRLFEAHNPNNSLFESSIQNKQRIIYLAFPSRPVISGIELNMVKGSLVICELQIFGDCPAQSYGVDCEKLCPMSCLNRSCSQDGTCLQCYGEAQGQFCTEGFRCPKGYTGKQCDILCHCKNDSCDVNGHCINESYCDIGWFGPACQYRDIANTAVGLDELLTDHDDTSCYKDENKRFEVKLNWPVVFTWARVVFHKSALVIIRALEFIAVVHGKQVSKTCQSLRTPDITDITFDVFCNDHNIVESFTLIWSGKGRVCSFYMNAGRNVELGGAAVEGCNYNSPNNFRAIFDGNSGIDSCFTFNSSYNTLQLITNSNQIVTGIIIHTKTTTETYSLIVKCMDATNKTVCDHTSSQSADNSLYIPVMKATVSKLMINVTSGSLTICEFQMFGECPPPYYGLYCNETCSDRCVGRQCNFEGECHQCKEENNRVLCEPDVPTTSTDSQEESSCPNDTQCHCTDNSCNENLSCKDGATCEKPWFSLGCQYYDAAYTAIVDSPLLTDHDDATCHASQNLTLKLNGSVVFTWARIVFQKKETPLVTLKFHVVEEGVDDVKDCLEQRTVETNKNTIDLFCANTLTVDQVMVSWNKSVQVCSVYINKGRNYALKASAVCMDEPETTDRVKKLMASIHDGISSQIECNIFSQDYMNTLHMTLQINRSVALVQLHIDSEQSEDYNVYVRLFEAHNPSVSQFESPIQNKQRIIYLAFPSRPVISGLELNMLKGSLAICELEIFGDCTPQNFGVNCENVCPMSCLNRLCSQDGTCLQCYEGRQGQFCTEGNTGCPSGYMGPKCEQLCHCNGGACDQNGECKGGVKCKPGWFGLACQYRDAAFHSRVPNPLLIDGDDSTCFAPSNRSVTVSLDNAILFTWARLVFHDTAYVFLEFPRFDVLKDGAMQSLTCDAWRIAEITSYRFDVFCANDLVVGAVTFKWKGFGDICSFYLNGGNTLARSSVMKVPPLCPVESFNHVQVLMDEDTTDNRGSVFNSSINVLHVYFETNKHITGINIITGQTSLTKYLFNVKCLDAHNTTVCSYVSSGIHQTVFTIAIMKRKVTKIILQVTGGSMTISELEVYGDCPPPYYGLNCEKKCSAACVGGVCNHNGTCHMCSGQDVDQHCSKKGSVATTKKPPRVASCSAGSFGRTCNKCRCGNEPCDRNGRCVNGSSCSRPWFALGCQYFDVAATAKVASLRLTDHDDKTCHTFGVKMITVDLAYPVAYTWTRIVFSDKGRNLAANSVITLKGDQGNSQRVKDLLALLNNEDSTSSDCFRFTSEDFNAVNITLRKQYYIGHVRIYTKGNGQEDGPHQINVYFYDTDGARKFAYQSDSSPQSIQHISIVERLEVYTLEIQVAKGSVSVCEIEIFGDCPRRTFDLDCESICLLTCRKDICNYDGTCYQCVSRREGRFCMENVEVDSFENHNHSFDTTIGTLVAFKSKSATSLWTYYAILAIGILLIVGMAYCVRPNAIHLKRFSLKRCDDQRTKSVLLVGLVPNRDLKRRISADDEECEYY